MAPRNGCELCWWKMSDEPTDILICDQCQGEITHRAEDLGWSHTCIMTATQKMEMNKGVDGRARHSPAGLQWNKAGTDRESRYMCLYCIYTQRELIAVGLQWRLWNFCFRTAVPKAGLFFSFLFFPFQLACLPSCETLMAVVHHGSAISCRWRDERSLTRVNDRGFAKEMKMYDFSSVPLSPRSGGQCIWMKKKGPLQRDVCIYNPLKPVGRLIPSDQ